MITIAADPSAGRGTAAEQRQFQRTELVRLDLLVSQYNFVV
jgi:hypothetical protein